MKTLEGDTIPKTVKGQQKDSRWATEDRYRRIDENKKNEQLQMTGTQCRDKCRLRGEDRRSARGKDITVRAKKTLKLENQEDKE